MAYSRLRDDGNELLNSGAARGNCVGADNIITAYQLDKLKFLTCAILSRRYVQDSEGVTGIFEELRVKFEQDYRLATLVLNSMLEIIGLHDQNRICADPRHPVLQDPGFQWRLKLIQYSDATVQCSKFKHFLDHMYKKYNIQLSREQVTSPVMLFQHMLERALITPGDEVVLQEMKAIVTICKYI